MYQRQYGLDVISLMPTNPYGPNDNYDLQSAHVLPALMRKIHEAKMHGAQEVQIWGSGRPRREFLHVDDAADAIVFSLRSVSNVTHLNVGCGEDISIRELAELLASVVEWHGDFSYQADMPDGMMRKRLDVSEMQKLGWAHTITLEDGLRRTYEWFLDHLDTLRGRDPDSIHSVPERDELRSPSSSPIDRRSPYCSSGARQVRCPRSQVGDIRTEPEDRAPAVAPCGTRDCRR